MKISVPRMENYDIRRKVGSGAFGNVFLAVHRVTGRNIVIKVIKTAGMTARERSDVTQEVKVLSQLRHPNIVEYMESFPDLNVE